MELSSLVNGKMCPTVYFSDAETLMLSQQGENILDGVRKIIWQRAKP